MQKGSISVQTENIFPIIKQFLYSDQEIFLRELVSNAVDATSKLKTLASRGDIKGDIGDTTIEVSVDKENKTITIADKGIGMTHEQIEQILTDTNAAISTRGTENEPGTGMGLLLCREMLEMQSGNLKISSEVGAGTTFSILLPKQTLLSKREEIGV